MNRPIRFRAWDKQESQIMYGVGKFTGNFTIDFNGRIYDTTLRPYDDRFELMQFTGLLDKNGKEIYEADIIKANEEQYLIKWNEHRMQFMAIGQTTWTGEKGPPGNPKVAGDELKDFRQHLIPEVIGNIYENKELLT